MTCQAVALVKALHESYLSDKHTKCQAVLIDKHYMTSNLSRKTQCVKQSHR